MVTERQMERGNTAIAVVTTPDKERTAAFLFYPAVYTIHLSVSSRPASRHGAVLTSDVSSAREAVSQSSVRVDAGGPRARAAGSVTTRPVLERTGIGGGCQRRGSRLRAASSARPSPARLSSADALPRRRRRRRRSVCVLCVIV